jgi:hypothetical protein
LAVAQNGPAPPTSSALTIIRLFRVVIESSNARAARFASVDFQRASWVLGSAEADVLNHRIAGTTAPALSARRRPSRQRPRQCPRQSKAVGSDELSFADSQQSRRVATTDGFALSPYVPRGHASTHTAALGVVGPTQERLPARSGAPAWSDCGQAHALAGTSPTYFRVLSVSRGFDCWPGSGEQGSYF